VYRCTVSNQAGAVTSAATELVLADDDEDDSRVNGNGGDLMEDGSIGRSSPGVGSTARGSPGGRGLHSFPIQLTLSSSAHRINLLSA